METLELIAQYIATHSLALGVGVATGLVVENVAKPMKRARAKLASLLGKAEETISE